MLFNSAEFPVFLLVVLVVYHGLLRGAAWRTRKALLVAASWAFYVSWSPPFGLLLLASTAGNFVVGLALEQARAPRTRRAIVAVAVGGNLGALAVFKYGSFVAANVQPLLGGADPALLDVILPIGISFYTFEALSYVVDVYRGDPACRSLLDFALFLSFFPHLVAGPIVRPHAFLPQLAAEPAVRGPSLELAVARIAQGLLEKVVLADTLGVYVDAVWGKRGYLPPAGGYPAGNAVLAVYAYAFQIYFDFAGYTHVALGLAQLFGLRLPENFDRPYLASSPREFWRRWHVSLSTWLRDYLYVSLGGNRRGTVRAYVNLLVTMLLGGLWHGAAWNFVLWGGYHGGLLAIHRWWSSRRPPPQGRVRRVAATLATFHLVTFGWVLFRMPSLMDGWRFVLGGLRPGYDPSRAGTLAALVVVLGAIAHAAPRSAVWRARFVRLPPLAQGVVYGLALVGGYLLAPPGARFIYFQF